MAREKTLTAEVAEKSNQGREENQIRASHREGALLKFRPDPGQLNRRDILRLTAAAAATTFLPGSWLVSTARAADVQGTETFDLSNGGGGVRVTFERSGNIFRLRQIQRGTQSPLLYSDSASKEIGAAPLGNPFVVHVLDGKSSGIYGPQSFQVTKIDHTPDRLLAYLRSDQIPLLLGLEISTQGDVIAWRAQAIWNGPDDANVDIYFPLLSRLRFDSKDGARDRLIAAQISGVEEHPLSSINFSSTYLGGLSSPAFMLEGGGRGLAFLDDNRADYAADPGGCCQRSCVVGNHFPLPDDGDAAHDLAPGNASDGPFAGWRHRRLLLGASHFGGDAEYDEAESPEALPMKKLGDSVDLGPVYSYAYDGSWKNGALWLREKRQHLPFRTSPAQWYRDTAVLSEENPDRLVRTNASLYDLPLLLEERHEAGSDMMSLPGFAEPEILGTDLNMLNRGDYFYPAHNLGGWDALRGGVEAMHRQGGHLLLYVEGLIVWKRSRIGRSKARDWALMDADGKLTENYRGFFDMCPAEPGWQEWFARTLADVVRTTDVDGFFMDSMLATDNHRCFNPKHNHAPQPDIWNWGLRRVLARVREDVDKVNPNTILLCEGAGDIAREFTDGSLSHGHAWTRMTFTVPLLRFLHPQMRAFEASGQQPRARDAAVWPVLRPLLWSAVQGYRVFTEMENHEIIAPLGRLVRNYFDLYPEVCDAEMSPFDVDASAGLVQLFDSLPRVITCGNDADSRRTITLSFPKEVHAAELFDRRDQKRIPVNEGKALLTLEPWELRAFELHA